MTNYKVWADPIGTPQRLKQLGLTESVLLLAVKRGDAAFASCTQNHPTLQRGIMGWGEPICSLRESLIPEGWNRYDEGNQPYVVNSDESLAITVATGDENTGLKDRNPSTKSSKGPQTEIAVAKNALARTLFGDIRSERQKRSGTRQTWILLIHRDEEKSETRCEFSSPSNMEGGYIDQWSERIILGTIPFGGGGAIKITNEPPPVTPDINISVKRRA
jgi:hypothetical protein